MISNTINLVRVDADSFRPTASALRLFLFADVTWLWQMVHILYWVLRYKNKLDMTYPGRGRLPTQPVHNYHPNERLLFKCSALTNAVLGELVWMRCERSGIARVRHILAGCVRARHGRHVLHALHRWGVLVRG